MVDAKPGSIEEVAEFGFPALEELTPEQTRAALEHSRLILGYVFLNLDSVSKPGSVGAVLAQLIFTYMGRTVPLAQLSAFSEMELPDVE